jgi:hypothetical protein
MITLKFKYSTNEYIYEIKSYCVNFSKNELKVKINEYNDNLFKWIKNNRDSSAKQYITDIIISDKTDDFSECYAFGECKLVKLVFDSNEYEITVSYKTLNIETD